MEPTLKQRCTAMKADGSRCRTFAVSPAKNGRGLCIFHDHELQRSAQNDYYQKPLTDLEMSVILSQQLRRINRNGKNTLEKSKEMRSLVEMIGQLSGKKPEEVAKEENVTLEDRIAKAKAEHNPSSE